MGDYSIGLPVGVTLLRNAEQTFTRASKDGSVVAFNLFGSDYFSGRMLGGGWVQGYNTQLAGPFLVTMNGGELELMGRSDGAGTYRYGWVWSTSKILLLDDCVLDVHLELEGHTSANNLDFYFAITSTKNNNPSHVNNESVLARLRTTSSTYYFAVLKTVGGVQSAVFVEKTVTNLQGTVRFKFEETKAGHRHTHIYYHDGTGNVSESTDELTAEGSPFTLGVNINSGYPAYEISTSETTNRTVNSDKCVVTYPDFTVKYDLADANINLGECKIFDTMGSATESDWQRIYSNNHRFTGECVIENGIVRVDELGDSADRPNLYYWNGSAYAKWGELITYVESGTLTGTTLVSVDKVSPEKVVVTIRENYSTYWVESQLTLCRGMNYVEKKSVSCENGMKNIIESVQIQKRFGFACLDTLRDGVAATGATTWNGSSTDGVSFGLQNNERDIPFLVQERTGSRMWHGGGSQQGATNLEVTPKGYNHLPRTYYVGALIFPNPSGLYRVAASATLAGGADTVTDSWATRGIAARLNAVNEYCHYTFSTGVLKVPKGRYLAYVRARDSTQKANDLKFYVEDNVKGYITSSKAESNFTLASSYDYYKIPFEINAENDGNNLRLLVQKTYTDSNSIRVDNFLMLPICRPSGDWVQDIGHNCLRSYEKTRGLSWR